jgi:hypothetical protein
MPIAKRPEVARGVEGRRDAAIGCATVHYGPTTEPGPAGRVSVKALVPLT